MALGNAKGTVVAADVQKDCEPALVINLQDALENDTLYQVSADSQVIINTAENLTFREKIAQKL